MASQTQKVAQKRVVSKNPSPQCQKEEATARRRVTYWALSNDEKCTMKLHIYLSNGSFTRTVVLIIVTTFLLLMTQWQRVQTK